MADPGRRAGRLGRDELVTIKDSAESWVRSKPALAMVAVAAVGLVIGGIVGLGVGYKIEKNRVQKDVQRLQKQLKSSGTPGTTTKVVQRVGQVKGVHGTTLTVHTKLQGDQTISTTSSTPFETTVAAKTADIAVGKKVLVADGGHEVIILGSNSEIGREVTNVNGDGFTVTLKKGKTANVKTKNVKKVYTLTAGKSSDAKVGTDVIVAGKRSGTNGFQAVEVIVLPTGNKFNS
jgi:hypothetical protein